MPAVRGEMWEHFYEGASRNKSHSDAWCRYCVDHHRPNSATQPTEVDGEGREEVAGLDLLHESWFKQACEKVKSVNGEKKAMIAHLIGGRSECPHAPDHAKNAARKLRGGLKESTKASEGKPKPKPKRAIFQAVEKTFTQTELKVFKGIDMPFTKEQKEMIAVQTVRATISANLPFRWIADPEVLRLLMMLRSAIGDALPSPNQVSGTLLDLEEKRVTDNVKTILRGQYVTVSIDGWSDKASVLGVDVSFDGKAYLVRSVSMKGRGKDGPAMCRTFIEMIDWVELEYACNVVGFCCDNDGGSQKGRKLLRVERPWLFNPPCCAHQGQLILADYFKENRDGSQTSEETADMLGWIRSHEKVRDIFDEVQVEKKGGEPLAYLVANLTRWTTHTISFHRTLSLKEPLRHAAILRCADILQAQLGAEKNKKKIAAVEKEVNRFCELLDDPGYWKRLERVSEDIEPVCYITNINQADNTRADQVLLGLAGVYLHFSRHPDPIVRAGMLARLEKRWEALDQPMFLFAVILNPYEKTDRFGGEAAVSVFTLASILVELYTRVKLRKLPDQDLSEVESRKQGEVRAAFMHYISGTGPFADFETNQEVFSQTNGTDPILVWQTFRSVAQVSELAELAMILLGLSVNQGGNERDFSDWKVKRTRLRNRLSFTKTTKMSKTVFKKNGTHERITMTTVSPN